MFYRSPRRKGGICWFYLISFEGQQSTLGMAPSERNSMTSRTSCWSYPDVGLLKCLQSEFGDNSLPDEVMSVVP
jgi:hypothetical protein